MNASDRRRLEDVRRLRELAGASNERIRITDVAGEPPRTVRLTLAYTTVPDARWPASTAKESDVRIELPPRYPMMAPRVTINTPIFHPNIYTSGVVCLGDTWLASETLDALVRRLIRLITFDPLISGGEPPANPAAMAWYRKQRAANPAIFPTQAVSFDVDSKRSASGVRFHDAKARVGEARVVRQCPECKKQLALPPGRNGRVRCPVCGSAFATTT